LLIFSPLLPPRTAAFVAAPRERRTCWVPSVCRGSTGDNEQLMLEEAARLKGEAEAAAAVLEAKKRLREEQERAVAASKADVEQEAMDIEGIKKDLEETQTQLRRAEAFSLPEKDGLQQKVKELEQLLAQLGGGSSDSATEVKPQVAAAPTPPPPPEEERVPGEVTRDGKPMSAWNDADWEDLAEKSELMSVEQRFDLAQALGPDGRQQLSEFTRKKEDAMEAARKKEEAARLNEAQTEAAKLRDRMSFESLKSMSNEERVKLATEVGPAYLTSLAIVAASYWALSVPFIIYGYHESTGKWPGLDSLGILASPEAAGMFAGIFATYALLKPARLFVALLLTPWTVENVMPRLPSWEAPKE